MIFFFTASVHVIMDKYFQCLAMVFVLFLTFLTFQAQTSMSFLTYFLYKLITFIG